MATYKIVNGKIVKTNDTEKDSNTTSLINTGGDTLTIVKVDPKTGKETIVRHGVSRSRSSTGLPSITPPTQEEIKKFYESQPEEKISVDEKLLKQELQKGGTQTITQGFMQLGNITGADIKLALSGLNKNPSQRTKEENQAIQKASQTSDQYRQALIQKQTQTITKTIPGETKKIITQLKEQPKQSNIFDTSYEARKSASQGNISGGFQMAGQIIKNISEKITLPKILTPLDFFPGFRELGKTNIPEEFAKGTIFGAGETIESAGNIIEAASKRKTYGTILKTGKETADYLIGVGKKAKIELVPTVGAIPILPKITLSEKHKKDVETGTILATTTGVKIYESFKENPGKELGKFVGGGAVISGTASIGGKLLGLGKAGVHIIKGGKYVKYETLYETNPKNLLQGKYKKGTPKSTIKEFYTGENKKTTFHSTGTNFLKQGKGVVQETTNLPKSDISSLYSSSGKANTTYLRISGQNSYNPTPRIPFVNAPLKSKPATLRLVGVSKPTRLSKLGKFKTVKQGRKVFSESNISRNIPTTSAANELGIKIENELLFKPGTVLTTKGIKGTQDFTFVKGIFVETPRVRVMPSNVKKNILQLTNKPKTKIIPKQEMQVSFEESLRNIMERPTVYNYPSLISQKTSSKTSTKTTKIISPSRTITTTTIQSIPSRSITPSVSIPSKIPSRTITRNITSSKPSISTSTSTSLITPIPSRSITRTPPIKPKILPKPQVYKPSLLYTKIAPRKVYRVSNVLSYKKIYEKSKKVRLF